MSDTDALKSVAMTPKGTADVWICRHCKARKIVEDPYNPPIRCWNSKCRRGDWHRPKLKEGRPRNDARKGTAGRPPKQGKARKKGK